MPRDGRQVPNGGCENHGPGTRPRRLQRSGLDAPAFTSHRATRQRRVSRPATRAETRPPLVDAPRPIVDRPPNASKCDLPGTVSTAEINQRRRPGPCPLTTDASDAITTTTVARSLGSTAARRGVTQVRGGLDLTVPLDEKWCLARPSYLVTDYSSFSSARAASSRPAQACASRAERHPDRQGAATTEVVWSAQAESDVARRRREPELVVVEVAHDGIGRGRAAGTAVGQWARGPGRAAWAAG
jgi:hypothetical protein